MMKAVLPHFNFDLLKKKWMVTTNQLDGWSKKLIDDFIHLSFQPKNTCTVYTKF